jgi:hypothetical protein
VAAWVLGSSVACSILVVSAEEIDGTFAPISRAFRRVPDRRSWVGSWDDQVGHRTSRPSCIPPRRSPTRRREEQAMTGVHRLHTQWSLSRENAEALRKPSQVRDIFCVQPLRPFEAMPPAEPAQGHSAWVIPRWSRRRAGRKCPSRQAPPHRVPAQNAVPGHRFKPGVRLRPVRASTSLVAAPTIHETASEFAQRSSSSAP